MNALRLVLLALGCLFAIAACLIVFGFAMDVLSGDESRTADEWLGILAVGAMFALPAVGLFYFARLVEQKKEESERAELISDASVQVFCSNCNSTRVAQGPEQTGWLVQKSHVARCLTCGHRFEMSQEEWRRLPLPEGGDEFETWRDKQHVMGRSPLTLGQAVFVLVGLLGAFVVFFSVLEINEVGNYDILFAPVAPVIMYGIWWTARRLFPPKRIGDDRCVNCGHDLPSSESSACPVCGTRT